MVVLWTVVTMFEYSCCRVYTFPSSYVCYTNFILCIMFGLFARVFDKVLWRAIGPGKSSVAHQAV